MLQQDEQTPDIALNSKITEEINLVLKEMKSGGKRQLGMHVMSSSSQASIFVVLGIKSLTACSHRYVQTLLRTNASQIAFVASCTNGISSGRNRPIQASEIYPIYMSVGGWGNRDIRHQAMTPSNGVPGKESSITCHCFRPEFPMKYTQ